MRLALLIPALLATAPASAEVVKVEGSTFVVEHKLAVAAAPDAVWRALSEPSRWWSEAHSWSGDAANLSMAMRPGGCFCEALPDGGGAEHARVIHVAPNRLLRLSGALGPLQQGAVTGTLSFEMTGEGQGTALVVRYVVSGYTGMDAAKLAPLVDGVIGEQAAGLKRAAEGVAG
jgi:uncharacterized protein YndB with AHSA1/START domain